MNMFAFVVFGVFLSRNIWYIEALTTTKYMTSYCNTRIPIFVNDSIIIELTNQLLEDRITTSVHCASMVTTDKSRRLLLHFLSLDISNDNQSPDSFHIYDVKDSGKIRQLTPPTGLYGLYDKFNTHTSSGVGDYMSSGPKFKLQYMGSPTLTFSGFKILITAFKKSHDDGTCSGLYGLCPGKGICVPYSVWCDNEGNCGQGDDSDEDSCNKVISTDWEYKCITIMASVTAAVAIAIFICTILVVLCILRRYNRRNYVRRTSIIVAAKKISNGKWSITNDMGLTMSMAPPMYEDVVGSEKDEEPPPSYDTVTTLITEQNRTSERHSRDGYTIVECHLEDGNVLCRPISQIAQPQIEAQTDCLSQSGDNSSSESQENIRNDLEETKLLNDPDSSSGCSSGSTDSAINSNELSNTSSHSRHIDPDTASSGSVRKGGEKYIKRIDIRRHSAILLDNDIEYIDDDE